MVAANNGPRAGAGAGQPHPTYLYRPVHLHPLSRLMSRHLLWLAAAIVAPSATGQQAACDWASFGTGSADVNTACCQGPSDFCSDGLPQGCSASCAATYIPFYNRCIGFLRTNMADHVAMFNAILTECQDTQAAGAIEQCTDGECAARHVNAIEEQLARDPVVWWQGDGSIYIGDRRTALQFSPCQPVCASHP